MNQWSAYKDSWSKSKAYEFQTLPDGTYIFTVDSAKTAVAKNGKDIIEWILITDSEGGPVKTRKTSFMSEAAFPMLKRDIKNLGVDPDTIDIVYIDQWLEYFAGTVVEGEVRNSESNGYKYNNINFTQLIRASGKKVPDQTGFEQVEDELPF